MPTPAAWSRQVSSIRHQLLRRRRMQTTTAAAMAPAPTTAPSQSNGPTLCPPHLHLFSQKPTCFRQSSVSLPPLPSSARAYLSTASMLMSAGTSEDQATASVKTTPEIDDVSRAEEASWGGRETSASSSEAAGADVSMSTRRVAPLPDDIIVEEGEEGVGETRMRRRQGRREAAGQGEEDEQEGLPFPRFFIPRAAGRDGGRQQKEMETLSLAEAIQRVKSHAKAKFVETVEAHVRLGIDPRRSDQMVRGAANLPRGTGSVVRVAVFAEGQAAEEAAAAGADVVGAAELIDAVKQSGGKLDFEKCVATPAMMPKLGQVARILGPRGLMPNPKLGTVTNNVAEAVRAAKMGRVDFRADKTAIVHAGVGKVNFSEDALHENIAAFAAALLAAKPVGLKKSSRFVGYFNSFTLSSTMGPGVRVSIQSVANAADSFIKRAS